MKIVYRTLVILVAALLVVAAAILFARTSWGAQVLAGGDRGPGFHGGSLGEGGKPGEGQAGARTERGGYGRENGGLGVFTLVTLGKNLFTIAIIVLAMSALGQALRLFRRRRLHPR
jgi:hypothetical protein